MDFVFRNSFNMRSKYKESKRRLSSCLLGLVRVVFLIVKNYKPFPRVHRLENKVKYLLSCYKKERIQMMSSHKTIYQYLPAGRRDLAVSRINLLNLHCKYKIR